MLTEIQNLKKEHQRISADIRNQQKRVNFSECNLGRDISIVEATNLSDDEIDKLIAGCDRHHYVYSYDPDKFWVSTTKYVTPTEHAFRIINDARHVQIVSVLNEMIVEQEKLYNAYKDLAKVANYGAIRKKR